MPDFTRPATWEDLKTLARHFNDVGVEYAIVGGYALAAHGLNRFTEDIDVLVNPAADNSHKWISALARLPDGAARELEADPDVFARDRRYAVRINDEFTIDVLPSVAGRSWDELRAHIHTIDLDGVPLKVLGLEGLLLTKQGARPKDQMDAAQLRRALEQIRGRQR